MLDETKDVLGNVEDGVAETKALLDRYNEISELMGDPDADFDALMSEMGVLQEKIDHLGAWDLDAQLEQAMDALNCPPPDADVSVLSGGERRRVALCKLLLQQPDLLLLDEPTNHLDAESVQWLEQHLEKYPGTIVAITHDRYFLENVAQWILELDRGLAYPYEGNYSTYLEAKAARLKVEGAKDAELRRRLTDELEWVRSNAKAGKTKSRARLGRYEEMASEAEKTRKLDFEEIQIPPGPRLGSLVVEAAGLTKAFDDRVLIDNLSFTLPRNGIVGIIGPNGVGKTTLFKMIVAQANEDTTDKAALPTLGDIRVGDTVKLPTWTRAVQAWTRRRTCGRSSPTDSTGSRSATSRCPRGRCRGVRSRVRTSRSRQVLSGGERNRLNLALTLKQGGNVILLEEPTNDLDVEMLDPWRTPAGVPGVCGDDLARPLVPRPRGHPHPGLRGRLAVVLVRGQLRVLREEQDRPPWPRGSPPPPRHLPQAHPRLTCIWVLRHFTRPLHPDTVDVPGLSRTHPARRRGRHEANRNDRRRRGGGDDDGGGVGECIRGGCRARRRAARHGHRGDLP